MDTKRIPRSHGIYQILNTVNGKRYIGSAVDLAKRWWQHKYNLKSRRHCNPKLQRAWDKHGEINIVFEVVELVYDKGDLVKREQHWIDVTDCVSNGYNISPTAYSSLGRTASAETRAKLSMALKGRVFTEEKRLRYKGRAVSEETRTKISTALTGKKRAKHTEEQRKARSEWQKGRKHTDESRKKLSIAHTGKKMSADAKRKMSEAQSNRAPITEETRRKLSEAGKGKIFTEERKANISAAKKGKKGAPLSEETKRKLSESLKGKPKPAGFGARVWATRRLTTE